MTAKTRILIVDDDANLCKTLFHILQAKGYVPTVAATGQAALDRLQEEKPIVALVDLRLEDMSGLEVMEQIRERSPGTECIVLTGYASQTSAIEAVNLGAYSYLQKPYDVEQLLVTVRRAVEKREAEEERERLLVAEREQRLQAETLRQMAGALNTSLDREQVLQLILDQLAQVVDYDSTSLMLVSDGALETVAHRGLRSKSQPFAPLPVDIFPHMQGVLESRAPIIIPDTLADSRWLHRPESEYIRCWLGVPLVVQDRAIGLLNLDREQPDSYTQRDAELAVAFANQAAVAIENARLFDETRLRTVYLEALNAIIAATAAVTNVPELLETTLNHILRALKLERGGIWVAGQHATRGVSPVIGPVVEQTALDAGLDLTASIVVEDWASEASASAYRVMAEIVSHLGVRAFVVVPILVKERRIGGLGVAASERRPWSAEEIALVEAVGRQLGTAVERLHLLEKTSEQAQQVQQIMDTVPEGVLLLDAEARILQANPAAQEYLAALTDAGVGDVLTELSVWPLQMLLEPPPPGILVHELALTGPPQRMFEVEAQQLAGEPAAGGWVLLIRDVTVARELQQQVQQQERLAAVGQLAAGIAHDFNNILTGMIGLAQLLQMYEDVPERAKADLGRIAQEGLRAAQLIRQILDFGRKSIRMPRLLDLAPFLKETAKFLERTIPENIRIALEITPSDYWIHADPAQIQQVLTNLAVNARDAMPEGGELRLRLSTLSLQPGDRALLPDLPPGEWVVLSVLDTGTGIPPEVIPHIFEPFFTTKQVGQGAGLGLAQVYGIVKQHDGYIDVVSHEGEGTIFFIYLPAAREKEKEAVAPGALVEETPVGRGETILLVEDDPTVLAVIQATLEQLGYRVLTAANGPEALAVHGQRGAEISLVLTDLVMPEMGGVALFHALQAHDPAIKVVVTTGYPLGEEYQQLQAQGIAGWIQKPPDRDQLARILRQALTSNQSMSLR